MLKESFVELNTLVGLLNENPKLRVEIGGHTDNVGNAEYNMNLSQHRADAVKNYLVEKGIEANRLQSKGYGFSKPIADNDSEQNRAKNRRIIYPNSKNRQHHYEGCGILCSQKYRIYCYGNWNTINNCWF